MPKNRVASRSMQPEISLIVCTCNRPSVLPGAVETLVQQSLPDQDYEIIVVDNSTDKNLSANCISEYKKNNHINYLVERTPGLSNARNVGVAASRAPYVAFMDDDGRADPSWAVEILRAKKKFGKNCGVIGGRVKPRWSGPRPPWLSDRQLGYLSIIDLGNRTRRRRKREHFAGCNMAFDKKLLIKAGGFRSDLGRMPDGRVLLSNEELETEKRIEKNGGISVYAPKAVVEHIIDTSRLRREWFRKRVAWQAVSDFISGDTFLYSNSAAPKQNLDRIKSAFSNGDMKSVFTETDDPDEFQQSLDLIYNFVSACLDSSSEVSPANETSLARLVANMFAQIVRKS